MRVLAVVHERDCGIGVCAGPVEDAGHEIVEWVPSEGAAPALDGFGAAIVCGGSMNVDEEAAHPWLVPEKALLREVVERELPALGLCLGAQLLAEVSGARPRRSARPEIGWHEITLTDAAASDPVLGSLPRELSALMWHSYEAPLPPGATALAHSPVCLHAYRLASGRSWGVQFHPEVTPTDLATWIAHHADDTDSLGVDFAAFAHENEARLAGWNELGRGIAARFLAAAAL